MKRKVWWPHMRQDILDLLQLCVVCKKNSPTPVPVKLVLPVEAMGPFKQWALDIVGPLPEDKAGKRFIITAIDYFTRWPVAWATTNHTATTVTRFIGREIVGRFGRPKRLITDGGRELVGNVMKAYCAKNALERVVTTPYHPQANGRVECLNGSLVQLLAKLCQDHPNTAWTEHLPTALLIARGRIN